MPSRALAEYMTSGATSLSVNLPGIALPVTSGTHRLVHLHQNVPGVLASINRVLTDIVPEYTEDVLAELRAMPVTIRLRTLGSP